MAGPDGPAVLHLSCNHFFGVQIKFMIDNTRCVWYYMGELYAMRHVGDYGIRDWSGEAGKNVEFYTFID